MNKLVRLASRMGSSPSYIFGRFASVRRAYAVSQRLARGPGTPLEVAPLYERRGTPVARTDSGLVLSDHELGEHVARLHETSWSAGVRLTPEAVEKLRAYAHAGKLSFLRSSTEYDDADSIAALTEEQRRGLTTVTLAQASEDPVVQAIAGDPLLVDVMTQYLGYPPRLVMPYFFWSFASDVPIEERVARNQTVLFHYDVQSYNFAYVSFYLYPTDRSNGAHVLIEGSHRAKKLAHLFGSARLSDMDAEGWYGKDRIAVIEGDAGAGFFEDTSCFHKALAPETGDRLMLQFRYL